MYVTRSKMRKSYYPWLLVKFLNQCCHWETLETVLLLGWVSDVAWRDAIASLEVKKKSCHSLERRAIAERLMLIFLPHEGRRTNNGEGCYVVVVSNWPNISCCTWAQSWRLCLSFCWGSIGLRFHMCWKAQLEETSSLKKLIKGIKSYQKRVSRYYFDGWWSAGGVLGATQLGCLWVSTIMPRRELSDIATD
jgi:hypothetical protein